MIKKYIRIKISVLIIVITAIIIFFLWYAKKTQQAGEAIKIIVPVEVMKPIFGSLEKTYKITGYVESENMVTVLPKIQGQLVKLNVDVGDFIKKGDIIGEIDKEPYYLTLKQAEAAYFAAKSTYERISKLYKANATSLQNYEQAKSQYQAYKSQYELAKLNYSYTDIKSPITGVVLVKHTSAGSLVAPQVPIVTIGDLSKLIFKAKIPEKYYSIFMKNKKHIKIFIDVPATNSKYLKARIKTISPYISPETKNFDIICDIVDKDQYLRPGMFIYITFILEKRDMIYYLPYKALVNNKFLWYVKNGLAKRLEFEPSFTTDQYFEIPEKYKNYNFIIDGQHFLKEGMKVKIISNSTEN